MKRVDLKQTRNWCETNKLHIQNEIRKKTTKYPNTSNQEIISEGQRSVETPCERKNVCHVFAYSQSCYAYIQSKLSAGGSNCETLRNLKNVPARTVSWAHDPFPGFAVIVIMMMWMTMTTAMMMMFMVVVVNSFWEALNLKPPLIAGTTNSGRNQ